jgi:hypothetical protein
MEMLFHVLMEDVLHLQINADHYMNALITKLDVVMVLVESSNFNAQ